MILPRYYNILKNKNLMKLFPSNILFNLQTDTLIQVLKEIFNDDSDIMNLLNDEPEVIKTIVDDIHNEIMITKNNTLKITLDRISYTSEQWLDKEVLKFDNN